MRKNIIKKRARSTEGQADASEAATKKSRTKEQDKAEKAAAKAKLQAEKQAEKDHKKRSAEVNKVRLIFGFGKSIFWPLKELRSWFAAPGIQVRDAARNQAMSF